MSVKVEIYRYDLTNGMASQMAPMLLGRPMEGVWHTSIVINGHEYYFDGGVGIDKGPAGRTRFGPPLRSEVLGFTARSVADFEAWNFQQMASNAFGPNSYNLMLCNCNHYSQAACQFLLSKDIPDDIRNMIPMLLQTPLGAMVAPILQQMASGGAGIGATPFGAGLGRSTAVPPTATSTTSASASASTAATATTHAAAALDADTQESLDIYLALIASDDANNDAKTTTLDALERIFTNIRNNPANQQYQRLSVTSDFYKNRIAAPFEVAQELLLLAGFEMDEGTHMVFRGDVARLTPFILAVQKSKASI